MILFGGAFISQIIPILISPLLTRFYSPADFGELAYIIGIVTVFSILSTGKLELAIPKAKSKKQQYALANLAVFFTLVTFLILTFISIYIVFFLKDADIKKYFDGDKVLFLFIPLGATITAFYQIMTYYANAQGNYPLIAKSGVAQSLLVNGMKVFLGFIVLPFGLILSTIIGRLVTVVFYGKNYFLSFFSCRFSIKYYYLTFLKNIDFPKYNMPSSLFNNMSIHLPIILMATHYGAVAVGLYAFSLRLLQLPVTFIGTSVGQIYYKEICTNDSEENILQLTLKLLTRLFSLGLPFLIIIMSYGVELFSFVFGDNWGDAGVVAICLAPWLFVVFISSPVSNLLIKKGKQKALFVYNVLLFSVRCSVVLICASLELDYIVASFLLGLTGFVVWSIVIGHILIMLKICKAMAFIFVAVPFLVILYFQLVFLNYV